MREEINQILNELKTGKSAILAVIFSKHGSAPANVGAVMAVSDGGIIAGTVGGGALEYESVRYSKELLKQKLSKNREYVLNDDYAANIGMICGGNVEIHFEYIKGEDADFISEIIESKGTIVLNLDRPLGLGKYTDKLYFKNIFVDFSEKINSNSVLKINSERYFFFETSRPKIYIFGGGHVSRALARVLSYLDFQIYILEDRKEFLNPDDFPVDANLILCDYNNLKEYIHLKKEDYVCILTRGHEYDIEIVEQILNIDLKYIGMIGSKIKVNAVKEDLKKQDFSLEQINSINMPIGLSIGAKTPYEIAVSIASQIISCRRNGR